MRVSDIAVLGKKILLGFIVAIVPLVILAGGLALAQKVARSNRMLSVSSEVRRAN
jgi:hypothetical protein